MYLVIIGFFGSGATLLWVASLKTPDLAQFDQRIVAQSTKIYDRTGETLLFDLHEDITRTVIPFETISRHVKNATVAIEDAEFYEHNGIKPTAILRAVWANLTSLGFAQGGSTITQQVVKNSILVTDKTIARKLKEWALALKLEKVYSKEQILEFYLNETPYGGSVYGVEEASQRFFDKSASEITLAESAYLAALPQAPTYFSPYGSHRDELENRKNTVLARMLQEGFISDTEHQEALEEEVEFKQFSPVGIQAPHFVFYVQDILQQKYGRRALEERGFRIITSLDAELQVKAEEIVNEYALSNAEVFDAENAALTAVDPRTGEILVMVGSRDYFDEEIDGNFNITTAHRQPGSAFKPFAYAEAFRKGYTPDTVLFDLETQFSTLCRPDEYITENPDCYTPVNYDDVYRGPVTLRDALAQSINVPAIKVLYLAGLQDVLTLAQRMGVQTLTNINQYGLTLVLGGGEVSLLDITSAYGVFANEGMRNDPVAILRIEDAEGNVVEEFRPTPRRVLEENVARQISDVLSDNDARAPAFGQFSHLHFPGRDVAAKTGTTNEYRDAWIVGYTPTIAAGAWAGNNDNTPMDKKVAGFIIAPLWNAFMKEALLKHEDIPFTDPVPAEEDELKPIMKGLWRGGVEYIIDTISGKLATEYTPEETRETRVITDVHSILHWVNKRDPLGPAPDDPSRDSQFDNWEFSVLKWRADNGIESEDESVIPTEFDDLHTPESLPNVSIQSPQPDITYSRFSTVPVSISSSGQYPITKVSVFVNGVFVGSTSQAPFNFTFVPNDIASIGSTNTLTVVAQDAVMNSRQVQSSFRISN